MAQHLTKYRAVLVQSISKTFEEGIKSLSLAQLSRKPQLVKPDLPFVIGNECSGVVTEVASDVTGVRVGQAIMSMTSNSMAEEVVVPSSLCVPKPASLSHAEAAGLMVGFITAYHGLAHRGQLREGEWLLVTGAAGGMGIAAIQVGKLLGARVIAAVSSSEKCEAAKRAGADHTINYTTEDLKERVSDITEGHFADVVYEVVGGDVFSKCVRCMASEGRLLVIGFASGTIPSIPVNLPLVKGFSVVGVRSGASLALHPELAKDTFSRLSAWARENRLPAPQVQVYPVERMRDAFTVLAERKVIGKAVVAWDAHAAKL